MKVVVAKALVYTGCLVLLAGAVGGLIRGTMFENQRREAEASTPPKFQQLNAEWCYKMEDNRIYCRYIDPKTGTPFYVRDGTKH